MFLGTYLHNIDNKNRLALPSKIAAKLSKSVVVSKGFDGCLELRTIEDFNKYADTLMSYSANKHENRIVVRQLLANASEIEIDSARRILIPSNLLKEVNITSDVTIIGIGNKLEIWDTKAYNSYKAKTDKTYEAIAERIEDDSK